MTQLIATTTKAGVVETFPIVPANEMLPSWYKTMPMTYDDPSKCPFKSIVRQSPTIKGCMGVNDLLHSGFIVPAWQDLSLVVYPDGRHIINPSPAYPDSVHVHDNRQAPSTFGKCVVFKLLTPWHLKSDEKFYISGVPYHHPLSIEYFVSPGIIGFKHQENLNMFIVAPLKELPYEIFIKAGQPMMHLLPLTEQRVVLDVNYDPNYKPYAASSFFIIHAYQRLLNVMRGKQ